MIYCCCLTVSYADLLKQFWRVVGVCTRLYTLLLECGILHVLIVQVLLGENHYAERSARQTIEILDRRSEFLDQKIAGVEAQIADLEAESSFVTNTAEEAKVRFY